jgi:hypothetical protein
MKVHKNISIDKDIEADLLKRKGFNCSLYFCEKYRGDFMDLKAKKALEEKLKAKLETVQKEISFLELEKSENKKIDSTSCSACGSNFSSGLRKKIIVKKTLFCKECYLSRPDDVKLALTKDD